MPEIKSIKATTNDVSLFLLEIVEEIETGKIDSNNLTFAMKEASGNWVTGEIGMDFSERQEAIAHLQTELTIEIIRKRSED
jgi:hypothetical protein